MANHPKNRDLYIYNPATLYQIISNIGPVQQLLANVRHPLLPGECVILTQERALKLADGQEDTFHLIGDSDFAADVLDEGIIKPFCTYKLELESDGDIPETPVAEEVAEPVAEEVAEPVAEEVAEPVAEEVAEPVAEEVAEEVAVEQSPVEDEQPSKRSTRKSATKE